MQARTSLSVCIKLPCLNNKNLNVQIKKGQDIKELVQHLIQTHAIPPYLTISIYSTILSAMNESCQKDQLNIHSTLSKHELRHLFVDAYQSNTLQYNNKPEDDIFPRAFHTLVHCPVTSIFDTLLELEQNYAIAIQELQTASDHELVAIQARQAQEIESVSMSSLESNIPGTNLSNQNSNMTTLFTRQVEEMEVFQATWQSEIMQTQQTQRQEYRDFVIELYRAYQSTLASLSDSEHLKPEDTLKKLDGKEIVAIAANRMRQWEEEQQQQQLQTADSVHSDSSHTSSHTTSLPTRPRTASLASSLGSPNLQHASFSPNELASLVRTASLSSGYDPVSVKNIQEMGFAKDQAESALILSNQNMEAAIALLLENPKKVDAYLAEQRLQLQQLEQQKHFKQMSHPPASSNTPYYRRSYSLSQVSRPSIPISRQHTTPTTASKRRYSLQRFSTTPTFLNMMGHKNTNNPPLSTHAATPTSTTPSPPPTTIATNTNKSWNPISFLQQQKQAMENTNLSSVRKLGGWLGKAMENLGIENENGTLEKREQAMISTQQQAPQLVESFTIMMGTVQVKTSHNLRLLVTNVATDIFHPEHYDPLREMAYRAETATKLYTSHLSAIIVLVEISELMSKRKEDTSITDWRLYRTGKSHSNKAFFERCRQSTEFHFPDVESQLRQIEEDFQPHQLTEGSFFITKHSNLPSTQIVFHLLIDSTAITATQLSNRHPLITGLRHILKITTQYDISSLSIPLLLLPDRFHELATDTTETQRSSWLQKRGEVVMKCIKGFLIENSRNGKRVQNEGLDRAESMGNGGLRNIEFLIPNNAEIYMGHHSLQQHPSHSQYINHGTNTTTTTTTSTTTTTTTTTTTAAITTNSNTSGIDTPLDTNGAQSMLIPQEVETAFEQFRALLVNLFRTS
ncbi:uncharacterized protein BX663DRAFT_547320 [Cokeromyces recurvatus]|uniref:uncharacterized protein n=1 Tax=Cokeromyces recurvatus TaxID=90255 RepID=UPI00222034A4|nr:uncharacterized protein BX663DRAFT_547320 [Cokeromyces recurvatus]KAI7907621.1 hypothetical protein BX663DRAFT_547320 [Cokeromyces recurvatus]